MLIDSHCHLPSLRNKEKLESTINEALAEGIGKLINIGTSIKTSEDAINVAAKYENIFATVSVYPHEELGETANYLQTQLKELILQNKVVAVGETGIDISNWEGGRSVEYQLELFEALINLALDYDLPVIIHNRNADELVIKTLQKFKTDNLRGVAHCFSSTWDVAQQFIEYNFLISFAGMITYPSRKSLLEIVEKVPIDRFLIETDSPYLPPQGHRGEENQPKYVKIVAEKIAQVKQKSFDEIAEASTANACRLFRI